MCVRLHQTDSESHSSVTHAVSKQWREAFGTVLSGVTG